MTTSTSSTPPRTAAPVLPRSFLYVPGNKPELFAKAAAGPADAVVLDLEDAVPLADKDTARAQVRARLADARGAEHWVRVDPDGLDADLDAVVRPGLAGLFLAKWSLDAQVGLAAALDRLEEERGLGPGAVRVVGLVETARTLRDLSTVAAAPRLTTLGIGEVDLLADLRMARTPGTSAAIDAVRLQVVTACAAADRSAPVAPTSTAFRDLESFAESTRALRDLGFRSRTAIHPAQVPVIHDVLAPSAGEVEAARSVIARSEAADGGVTTDAQGRLIDAAVVRGARETLARAGQDAAAVRRR